MNRSTARGDASKAARMEGIWNEPCTAKPADLGVQPERGYSVRRAVPAAAAVFAAVLAGEAADGDVYTVDDQQLIGMADTPPVAQVRLRLTVEGTPIEIVRPVRYRYADRAEGERVRPLVVVPAGGRESCPTPWPCFPARRAARRAGGRKANMANAAGELRLECRRAGRPSRARSPSAMAAGDEQELTFEVTPPAGEAPPPLRAVATVNGARDRRGIAGDLLSAFPAADTVSALGDQAGAANIQVTAHRVGYIMGAGDEMPDALRQLGLEVTLLTAADLEQGDLARFDAIVAGVRAYNVRADLRANQAAPAGLREERRHVRGAIPDRRRRH